MAIDMTRRELLIRSGVILLLVPIASSCSSSTYGGSGKQASADAASCDGIDSTGTVVQSHTHEVCVPSSDLASPPAAGATYTTTNVSAHTHTVTLTQAQLQQIAAGGTVAVTSSTVEAHTHDFAIMRA